MRRRSSLVWLPLATAPLMLVGRASAQWWWPPSDFAAQPDCALRSATITLGGDWHDSCIPNASSFSTNGFRIDMVLRTDYPIGVGCLSVIRPWSRAETVQIEAPGTYSVYAEWIDRGTSHGQPTLVGSFAFDCGCPSDIGAPNGGIPDAAVTIDDLLLYLEWFEAGDERAGFGDGAVTIDDLLYFLERYEFGC